MTFPDYPKPTIFALLATLTVLPCWQIAGAADSEGVRHSLIHRPQIQTTPGLNRIPAPANPTASASTSSPSQPLTRKIVRRPSAPSAAIAQASSGAALSPAQTDPSRTMSQPIPDDDAPEPELEPAPQE